VCGYGRVGSVVTRALTERGLPVVVIEEHLEHVRQVRQAGIACLVGDASNAILLDRAGVGTARALVVAIPDVAGARRIVGHARAANPWLKIIVRTHARREIAELGRIGASKVVLGELETAVEIARQTLRTFDVSAEDTERQLDAVRAAINGA
jgi:CPA2 family monovalent cation:H+ antiporter-2